MREVQDRGAPVTAEVVDAFATCVQCRGCEPACPSSVPYGHLMEQTREVLVAEGAMTPRWQQLALKPLGMPRVLKAGSAALAVLNKTGLVPSRLGLPAELQVRRQPLATSGSDVWLFTGCVMDAWQREVHQATQRVVEAAGFGVTPTGEQAPCCGALHSHAGMGRDARSLAQAVIDGLSTGPAAEAPILVNSAGCGAAMKDYGHLLGTDQAAAFAARVFDISEFLADHVDTLVLRMRDNGGGPLDTTVAIQDPCHLRHVQRVHEATRQVLRPFVAELIELDDDGLCCGAGGAYSLLQPDLAAQIRDRKVAAIDRVGPQAVASANPGCSLHLAQAGVPTVHPLELVDRAIAG
jgi:glycolate oxidase iron-sulfur subunit